LETDDDDDDDDGRWTMTTELQQNLI